MMQQLLKLTISNNKRCHLLNQALIRLVKHEEWIATNIQDWCVRVVELFLFFFVPFVYDLMSNFFIRRASTLLVFTLMCFVSLCTTNSVIMKKYFQPFILCFAYHSVDAMSKAMDGRVSRLNIKAEWKTYEIFWYFLKTFVRNENVKMWLDGIWGKSATWLEINRLPSLQA